MIKKYGSLGGEASSYENKALVLKTITKDKKILNAIDAMLPAIAKAKEDDDRGDPDLFKIGKSQFISASADMSNAFKNILKGLSADSKERKIVQQMKDAQDKIWSDGKKAGLRF